MMVGLSFFELYGAIVLAMITFHVLLLAVDAFLGDDE